MPQYHQRRTGKTLSKQTYILKIFIYCSLMFQIVSCSNNQKRIEQTVEKMQDTLPIIIDDNTTLIEIKAVLSAIGTDGDSHARHILIKHVNRALVL